MLEEYETAEYFTSSFREGVYDQNSQWWIIHRQEELYEHHDFLVVGSPGVDMIEFGYRKGEYGIWMYEPIGEEFRYLAPSLAVLLEGWDTGAITV